MIQRARSWTCRVTGATWLPQTPEAVVKSADSSATLQKWWADPKLQSLMVENWMTIDWTPGCHVFEHTHLVQDFKGSLTWRWEDNTSPTELRGVGCKLPAWPRLSCVERLKIFFNFKANVPDGSHGQKPSETDSNLTCVPYGCFPNGVSTTVLDYDLSRS